MTKKTLNFTIVILLISSLTITNFGCGKVSDLINGEDNNPLYAISSDKTTVSPFETVTLTIEDYIFAEESYLAGIYDREVKLMKISDTQLIFMMPYITGGERIMEFIIEDVSHEIYFTINAPEPIENPEEVIDSYKQNVVVAFDSLVLMNQLYNLQIDPQNLQVIEYHLNDFNQAYATATEDEKQELAQFMQANPDIFDFSNFDYSFFNDSLNTSRDFVQWDQKLTRDMQYFTGLVIATGATVGLFNGALISLNPLAIFITGGALLTEVYLLKSQTKTILNRSYKPFEFDISNELRSQTIEFDNEVEYILGIDGTYRTLYNNDQGSSSVIIELVANINTFTGYWNNVLENIPGVSGSVTNLSNQNSYVVNVNESSITPQYISIKNISNSNVVLSNYSNTNAVKVTFTTSAQEDQNFTFDIVYKNPDFSEEKLTVNAIISVVEPFYLTGHWNFTWYTDDTRTEATQIDLIDFQNGPPAVGEPISSYYVSSGETVSTVGSPSTWNQSFNPDQGGYELPVVSLTNNYWGNILLRFVYDEENPNVLIGESIGLSNNGFNLELTKQ